MLRWLLRLLIIGLVVGISVQVISRLLNKEEDFDDFDDIDAGFAFAETPVEIDVPAEEDTAAPASSTSRASTQEARQDEEDSGSQAI